mmetsp:Transcript_12209/g.13704  ORF Transcript_12209/g.13704 Transcript_12209/m.13704 type:complete len:165 (-) Transcript_12209:443-937(-)
MKKLQMTSTNRIQKSTMDGTWMTIAFLWMKIKWKKKGEIRRQRKMMMKKIGCHDATGAMEDGSKTTSTIGENDGGIEQKIKTPTEQEDPTEQEEKTASAEAVENGDTQDKTMEDSNLDLTGTTPAVSTKQQDTDEKSETEEGEITNEKVAKKNKNENMKRGLGK